MFFLILFIQVFTSTGFASDQEVLRELLIVKSEKQAMQQLEKLLAKHRGSGLEPELLLRKGSLFQRMGRSARYFEYQYEEGSTMSLLPKPVQGLQAKASLNKAISTFENVLRRFPKFSRNDEVVFNIAFSLQQLGELGRAKERFLELCAKFPYSPLLSDAYLAAAEIDYEEKRFESAFALYGKVQVNESKFNYVYSLYKSGWSLYNQQKPDSALTYLEKVAAIHDVKQPESLEFNMRPEALRDMVLFFSDAKKWSEAISYFTRQAREEADLYVYRLGKLYQHRDQWEDLNQLFYQHLKEFPVSKKMPDVFSDLMVSKNRKNQFGEVVTLIERFKNACFESCKERFLKTVIEYPVKWHQNWRKTKNATYGENAILAYDQYLSVRGPGITGDKTRYQLAELLFEMEKYDRASLEYEAVAKVIADPVLAHDAPYGAVLSLEKLVGSRPWTDQEKTRFQGLASLYVEKNPKGKYRLDLRFKQGLIALDRKELQFAAACFYEIGDRSAGFQKEKIIQAQDLYLDILNDLKSFAELAKAAGKWALTATLERREKMHKTARQAEFAEIEGIVAAGQFKLAAERLFVFQNSKPVDELTEKAWWNRSLILIKSGERKKSAQAALEFSRSYPKSEYTKKALALAAENFERLADLEPAAAALELLSEVETDLKFQINYQITAASFYRLSAKTNLAVKLLEKIISQNKNLENTTRRQVFLQLYSLKAEDQDLLKRMLNSGIPEVEATAFLTQARKDFKDKKYSQAFSNAAKVLSRKSASVTVLAEARFLQSRILHEEFLNQSLFVKDASRLGLVLALKTEKLQKAQKAFQATIRIGDPEFATQSYLRLGLLYSDFTKSLQSFKAPEGLSEVDAKALQSEMNGLVAPMEDQAAASFEEGIRFAKKYSVHSEVVASLQVELNRVNMQPVLNVSNVKQVYTLPMLPVRRTEI